MSASTSKEPVIIVQEQPNGSWIEIPAAEVSTGNGPWFAIQGQGTITDFRRFLESQKPQEPPPSQRYKLIFFVPIASAEAVKNGIFEAGGGTFPSGKYTHCSFESPGTGQFLPVAEKGANPTIGQLKGDGSASYRVERVDELRCEIICVGRGVLAESVAALKRYHPYEEPAYEVYNLENI